MSEKYIHGYDPQEQKRLLAQAELFEQEIYPFFNFSKIHHLLELGCGVGAQTKILLRKNKKMQITCVDTSLEQLATARRNHRGENRIQFCHLQDDWPFPQDKFDGAFLCWVLEHVEDPLEVLRKCRSSLRKGSPIFLTEVFHNSLATDPEMPSYIKLWDKLVEAQRRAGGDPQVGFKLKAYLLQAGFSEVEVQPHALCITSKDSDFKVWRKYWIDLATSMVPLATRLSLPSQTPQKRSA
jgi:SAM-dependent methyltransferase